MRHKEVRHSSLLRHSSTFLPPFSSRASKVFVFIPGVIDKFTSRIEHTSSLFIHTPRVPSFMWSSRLVRTPLIRSVAAPGRAFASSFTRGRRSPRIPRDATPRPRPIANHRGTVSPQQSEQPNTEPNRPNPNYDPAQNTLLSPVHIPENPNGVLKETHPAMGILANSGLVIQRQLELMNVMMYAASYIAETSCQS